VSAFLDSSNVLGIIGQSLKQVMDGHNTLFRETKSLITIHRRMTVFECTYESFHACNTRSSMPYVRTKRSATIIRSHSNPPGGVLIRATEKRTRSAPVFAGTSLRLTVILEAR
jgi:hypothetical protein